MQVEIVELNDRGLPSDNVRVATLEAVPRMGEMIALVENGLKPLYFDVVNVLHKLERERCTICLFVRTRRDPYERTETRFGFGSRG